MIFRYLVSIFIFFFLISCGNQKKEDIEILLQSWNEREVLFPEDMIFTVKGKDTVDFLLSGKYKILTYVDSIGCISCKLQLGRWKTLIKEMNGDGSESVKFLFFFSPEKRRDFLGTLKSEDFVYPICLDDENKLNKLNHFPSDMMFQTFLLDQNNKVVAIGNPIHNPKVKDLYLKIIQGEGVGQKDESKTIQTEVTVDPTSVSFGKFDWQEEQKTIFTLKNTGDKLLAIQDVVTSCGCTSVEYQKEPVKVNDSVQLCVTYQAEHPEYFNKTITVYCNTENSPITLRITGEGRRISGN